jgi:hypothetical protein
MIGANCASCAFFSAAPWADPANRVTIGQCRRNAPVFQLLEGKPKTVWPFVRDGDFCGEHAVMAEG